MCNIKKASKKKKEPAYDRSLWTIQTAGIIVFITSSRAPFWVNGACPGNHFLSGSVFCQ
jgi:hypothetical protein